MQKNVSPITAVIIILAVIAVAAFFWMKYSAGPEATTFERRQQGKSSSKQTSKRSERQQAPGTRNPRRGTARAVLGDGTGQAGEAGGSEKTTKPTGD